jgi:hypothetical protein
MTAQRRYPWTDLINPMATLLACFDAIPHSVAIRGAGGDRLDADLLTSIQA